MTNTCIHLIELQPPQRT